MDSTVSLLDFQISRLGYQFQNLDLLIEAITHSLDKCQEHRDFPEKTRNYERLCCLGEPVLKLLASQYVLMATKIGQENMTWLKSKLLMIPTQNEIGEKLFCSPSSKNNSNGLGTKRKRPELIRVDPGNWVNPGFTVPYHKIVKAIFGAVFIDAGGSTGIGLAKCHKLFLKHWRPHLKHSGELKKIQYCFPSPKREVTQFWLKNGVNLKFIHRMEERLGVQFKKGDILCEAVIQIQKSFYDLIRNDPVVGKMHQPDYERLEFLGDSVLGLVITEHIWNSHSKKSATEIVAEVTSLIIDAYQVRMYKKMGLEQFVRMKRGKIQGWDKQGDIVESVIGAVFVDGGIRKARDFVLRQWGLPLQHIREVSGLNDMQLKLNYKFKKETYLRMALTSPKIGGDDNDVQTMTGKRLLSLFSAEYVARSSPVNKRGGKDMMSSVKSLMHQSVLEGIAVYLDLARNILVPDNSEQDDDDDDHEANLEKKGTKCGQYVLKIFGAIWMDLVGTTNSNMISIFRRSFYHVWNPYLQWLPSKTLAQHIQGKTKKDGVNGLEATVERVQDFVPHEFNNDELLWSLLAEDGIRVKFEFIGRHILSLMALQIRERRNRKHMQDVTTATLENAVLKFAAARLHIDEICVMSNSYKSCGKGKQITSKNDLLYGLFGAIFADLHDGTRATITSGDWFKMILGINSDDVDIIM